MGPIEVVVEDGNNIVLEVTPTPNTTVILDRGIAGPTGPVGPPGPAGSGDVNGPASSTDNALARFDGTTGKLIQNSVGILSDAGALVGLTAVDTTTLDATNINALDGTASFTIANTTGVMTINDNKFTLQDNTDNTKKAVFELSSLTTGTTFTYTLPTLTGTLATTGTLTQTFSGGTTFSATFALSTTGNTISLGTSQTTGVLTMGGTAGTGILTLGRSTVSQTTNIQAGATASGSTKTINFGTGGLAGSITNIAIGSSAGTSTTTVSGNFAANLANSTGLPISTGVSGLGTGVATALAVNVDTVGGFGNVIGPASATDNAVARFDGATGKLIQNSVGILSDAGIFSGVGVESRVVVIANATSITVNADTTDIATQDNTQVVGTLTINAPTGTVVNGQKFILRLTSTNIQTFSWNAVFAGSTDIALPISSSGGGLTDYIGFIYNSTSAKWQMIAKVFGF